MAAQLADLEAKQPGLNPARASAELSTYTAGNKLDVPSPTGAVSQALRTSAEAIGAMPAVTGAISAQISTQLAAQKGKDLANSDPGMELLPAFTKSDAAFTQAYEQEEYNNINFQGQKFFEEAANLVHQDPTSQNLMKYQAASKQTIDNLLAQTSKANRTDIERSLQGKFITQNMQLSRAVESRNKEIMSQNSTVAHNQGLEDAYTQGALKQFGALDDTIANLRKNNQNFLAQNPEKKEVYQSRNETINIQEGVSRNIASLMQAEREGYGDAFLDNFVKTPYPAYSIQEKEAIGQTLYKRLHAQRALTSGQQQINYTRASTSLETGDITPTFFDDIRGEVTGQQYAQLEQKYRQQQAENILTGSGVIDINKNSNNAAVLAQLPDAPFNKSFAAIVAKSNLSPDPILNASLVAGSINRNNPMVTKILEQAISYGNPQEALSATSAVSYLLNQNNGVAVQTMDKQARSIGSLYELYARDSSQTPAEALKRARDQVLKQDPLTRETRLSELNTNISKTGSDLVSLKKNLVTVLSEGNAVTRGFGITEKTVIPDAAASAYLNSIISYSLNGLSFKEAKLNAAIDVAIAYPQTHVNGVPERMAYANMMPYGDDVVANRASIHESLAGVADRNMAAREAGQSVVQVLDWDGNTLKVNGIARDVKVGADYLTDLHKGKAWSMYYVDDKGLRVNIVDVDPKAPNGIARWIPTPVSEQ